MILVELFAVRYDTLSVRSGEEALDKIVSFDPHLVLLDVMMPGMDGLHGWIGPGMDGFDVCRWMRTQPSLRETKVVMLSLDPQLKTSVKASRPAPMSTSPSRLRYSLCATTLPG